jgi:hypothetical protein
LADCLAAEAPDTAEEHVDQALPVLDRIGARNDVAKALVIKARLRQAAGDIGTARRLLQQAAAIFAALGTLDEPARVAMTLAALKPRSGTGPASEGATWQRPLSAENGGLLDG